MSTIISIPVACDEHDVTTILRRVAAARWQVAGLHCHDCDANFWADEES